MAPSFAGTNLHYNKAREHKLEHEMDDTEQREYGENSDWAISWVPKCRPRTWG